MNKKFIILAVLCLFSLKIWAQQPGQVLVWEENFNGSVLNPETWTYEIGDGCANGNCGWGNQELESYTSRTENVRLEGGNLIIEAKKENYAGKEFTSARIKTANRVAFTYGTLEARIKVPKLGNGLWPAFWLLGANGVWPKSGEIDILEMGFAKAIAENRVEKTVSAATHWFTENPGGYTGHATHAFDKVSDVDLSDDFHLYKLVWDKEFIRIFVDNSEYFTINITGGNGFEAFHRPFYVLLNLAVGGSYTGVMTPAGVTAPLPGKMEVDYIKLYQTPGDELLLAKNNAPEGNFGVYTETTTVSEKLTYGVDANLNFWNNIQNITAPAPVPFEGNDVMAFRAKQGQWFGLGVANDSKTMIHFANGQLKFNMKTSSSAVFKVGVISSGGESWLNFNGTEEFGLVRDGQWHEVSIPISRFTGLDLYGVTQMFTLAGDAPAADFDFFIDNIYYAGGVSDNPAPSVSITAPSDAVTFTRPADLTITTNASDPNGTVTKVDFFNDKTFLGTAATAPFNYQWNNVPAGVHKLIAKVTDDGGITKTSVPVTIFVADAGNVAPQVSIVSPTPTSEYMKPATVNIQANATDTDGTIYKVEFYNGATLLGTDFTAPYTFAWANVDMGSYTLTAKAYDNGNLSTVSSPVTFTVADNIVTATKFGIYTEDASVTSKLTYGQNAELYIWNNLATVAGASAYEGAEVLAFKASAGNWFGMGVDNTTRNLSRFSNGFLKFHFKTSYSGGFKFGLATGSGEAWLEFAAAEEKNGLVRDGQWHEVTIPLASLSGLNLATLEQAFMFAGDAPSADTEFYFDHIYFTQGDVTPSLPTVALTSPTAGASLTAPATITLAATATDTDGTITKVDFYNGTTLLGTATAEPYTFTWNTVVAGTYSLTAKATDNSGLVTTSAAVSVTVKANEAVNLALNKPALASSEENIVTPASSAVDGDKGTRWSSGFEEGQWISVDLGSVYKINQVKITWEGAYASGYIIQTSLDDDNWKDVKTITGNTELENDHTGLSEAARYVRILGTQRALTLYGISIYELEVYGTDIALPVNLIAFNVKLTDSGEVSADWATAAETNNDYFLVERSADARVFEELGKVFASESSAQRLNQYQLIDHKPLAGINYYRLSQFDKDGTKTVYRIKSVNTESKSLVKAVYPHPVRETSFSVDLGREMSGTISVQILNLAGTTIHREVIENKGAVLTVRLLQKPAPGLYILRLNGKAGYKVMIE